MSRLDFSFDLQELLRDARGHRRAPCMPGAAVAHAAAGATARRGEAGLVMILPAVPRLQLDKGAGRAEAGRPGRLRYEV